MTGAPHADSSRATGTALEVELSRCCGALPGDFCRCAQDAADVARLSKTAIFLDLRGPGAHAGPPAKNGYQ